ncbi:growth-arrest-specific micro-tubule binding-domain-containing protein, partial [Ochromonadaceae sp. CCMP2298]
EYDTMDLEMLREVVPMLRQQLEKSMLDRNYVQLERDSIQQYFDTSRREVRELELAVSAKDREMELLEDNHRVELRVYQQKVKHLEYEHKNNIKTIVQDGTGLLGVEHNTHEDRERELLRVKEQLKFEQMELELVNTSKVAEVRQQHDKQLAKLRQQFEDGMAELRSHCESRLRTLETDLELRRRVEVHEVEERKNQHINDLVRNHLKAFSQVLNPPICTAAYYNDITRTNLNMIKRLQNQVEVLKERAVSNKKLLLEYVQENQKLSKPLSEVSSEIAELQALLKERGKDQMALRNANSRLSAIGKSSSAVRGKLQQLEDEYGAVEKERDLLYSGFEESIQRVRQQSEFTNQALEQRLLAAEGNVEKAAVQVEELIRAASLDSGEVARMMASLNQILALKDEALGDIRFDVVKLAKSYNDSLDTFSAKMVELGIPEDEFAGNGFRPEKLPVGCTPGPAVSLIAQS